MERCFRDPDARFQHDLAGIAHKRRVCNPLLFSYSTAGRSAMGSDAHARNHLRAEYSALENVMNRNQAKGTAKDVAGKVQEELGKAVDSPAEQAKGLARQVEGKVQKGIGNVQEAARNTDRKTDR